MLILFARRHCRRYGRISRDLEKFEPVGKAGKGACLVVRDDAWAEKYFWAPEVKYYKGKFYLAYSSMDPESGLLLPALAVSDAPGGPFREMYAPWFNLGHSAIDCHIFVDDDGAPYLYFSKNGINEPLRCSNTAPETSRSGIVLIKFASQW